jgi:hypothetical protein
MTRRRGAPNDPTATRALRGSDAEVLQDVLDTLPERDLGVLRLYWGLDDGIPKTLDEVSKMQGVTRERIRRIEGKALSKLRHPSRGEALRVWDKDMHPIDVIDVRRKHHRTLTRQQLEAIGVVWCAYCHQRPFNSITGDRRRAYCSDKCRQAAYRERRRQAGASDDHTDQAGELAG